MYIQEIQFSIIATQVNANGVWINWYYLAAWYPPRLTGPPITNMSYSAHLKCSPRHQMKHHGKPVKNVKCYWSMCIWIVSECSYGDGLHTSLTDSHGNDLNPKCWRQAWKVSLAVNFPESWWAQPGIRSHWRITHIHPQGQEKGTAMPTFTPSARIHSGHNSTPRTEQTRANGDAPKGRVYRRARRGFL